MHSKGTTFGIRPVVSNPKPKTRSSLHFWVASPFIFSCQPQPLLHTLVRDRGSTGLCWKYRGLTSIPNTESGFSGDMEHINWSVCPCALTSSREWSREGMTAFSFVEPTGQINAWSMKCCVTTMVLYTQYLRLVHWLPTLSRLRGERQTLPVQRLNKQEEEWQGSLRWETMSLCSTKNPRQWQKEGGNRVREWGYSTENYILKWHYGRAVWGSLTQALGSEGQSCKPVLIPQGSFVMQRAPWDDSLGGHQCRHRDVYTLS